MRYFFTVEPGVTPQMLTLTMNFNQCQAPTGITQWAGNIFAVNLSCVGIPVYPGGQQFWRKEIQFRVTSSGAWDPTNDWSFTGVAPTPGATPVRVDHIAIYDSGKLVWGVEPSGGDTQAPTAPSGLAVTGHTSSTISLAWTAATDNVGVTAYRILEGTTQVGTTATTSFTVTGLAASSTHTYTVIAVDAAGNRSTASTAVTATTSAPGTGGLKGQYFAADTNPGDNQVRPHFNLVNIGTTSVALSTVTLRYWYTINGQRPEVFWCDWTPLGCNNVTGQFVALSPARSGADTYLEVGFTAGMGSLAPGQSTGEIQARFNKDDWSNFNESDDYSFDPTKLSFADWDRVTVYQNGTLIWGTEPPLASSAVVQAAAPVDRHRDDGAPEVGASSGGCSTGAGGSPLGLVLVLGSLVLRRRRRPQA
jgi:MYXO-CTERM domain-containing protein